MRLSRLDGVVLGEAEVALVFFLQALEEQLYDRTDHSYKAPALNTFTRTLELQFLARNNFKSGIGKEALRPFVEELKWSVSRDVALSSEQRALCQVHVETAMDSISDPDRIARSLAGLRISLGGYFDIVKGRIKDVILESPRKKSDIYQLASSFIVQAETMGYPRRHTYHVIHRVARGLDDRRIKDVAAVLDSLFSEFVGIAEFECILAVSKGVCYYEALMKKFKISVVDGEFDLAGLSVRQANFASVKSDHQVFVKIPSGKVQSVVRAAQVASLIYSSFSAIVRSVDHSFDPLANDLTLVERLSDKKKFIVRKNLDPMRCWSPSVSKDDEYMLLLADAVHGNHLLEESKRRLSKAVSYHSSALDTSSLPNKLTTLWAGLEGLLSTPRKGVSRIDFFSECLLPALTLGYPEYLLKSLMAKIYKVPGVKVAIEKEVGGVDSEFVKFSKFVLCEEFDDKRGVVVDLLGNDYLLARHRCFEVWNKLKSASSVLSTLKYHREKVKWHIERIYSMRNTIMHDASSLPYIDTLVENIHGYMDVLIESIARIAVSAEEPVSIESAILYMSSLERYRMDRLAGLGDERVSSENIGDIIFFDGAGFDLHV